MSIIITTPLVIIIIIIIVIIIVVVVIWVWLIIPGQNGMRKCYLINRKEVGESM